MKVTKAVSRTTGKLSVPGQNLCQVIIAVLSKRKFLAGGNLLRGKKLQPFSPIPVTLQKDFLFLYKLKGSQTHKCLVKYYQCSWQCLLRKTAQKIAVLTSDFLKRFPADDGLLSEL